MQRILKITAFLTVAAIGMVAFAYGNEAAARARSQICDTGVREVCALNRDGTRTNYSNECRARQAGARVLHPGNCLGPICVLGILMVDPVCARDAKGVTKTYPNLCAAENDNAVLLHKGPCRKR